MMKRISWVLGFFLVGIGIHFLGGCSKGPQQYKAGVPPIVSSNASTILGKAPLAEIQDPNGDSSQDDIARANSLKPILYNEGGVAGINMNTSFADSKKLLEKPSDGPYPQGQTGDLYAYQSGVYVIWRKRAPHAPAIIIITPEYQGAMDVPVPMGKIHVGTNFSKFFKSQDDKGEALVTHLFNLLENREASYDCLKAKLCATALESGDITLELPKAIFVIEKDRKILKEIILRKKFSEGPLGNEVDLLTGQISVPASENQKADLIHLGDSWGQILDKGIVAPPVQKSSESFEAPFGNVSAILSKSKTDPNYNEPTRDEVLKGMAFFSGFALPYRIGENHVEVSTKGASVDLRLVALDAQPAPGATLLQGKLSLASTAQGPFLKALAGLIEDQFKLQDKDAVTFKMFRGLFGDSDERTLIAEIYQFSMTKKTGRLVRLIVSENTGNLDAVIIRNLDNPADASVLASMLTPLRPADKLLGGFKIGQTFMARDIGPTQVMLTFDSKSLHETVQVQASYDPEGSLRLASDADHIQSVPLHQFVISDFGIVISARPIKLNKILGIEEATFQVFAVSTVENPAGINDLCGIKGMSIPSGLTAERFKHIVDSRVLTRSGEKKNTCYQIEDDGGSANKITAIHFPKDGLKVTFRLGQVSSITVYSIGQENKP